jgi:sugar lactone lactonase YvrE
MRPALLFTLGLVSAGYLAAQQGSLTGPVEAYTFDAPTRSLRAVIGLPGAASFGPALRDSLDFASVAPSQSYGIGFQRGQCLLISGLGSTLATRTLSGVEAQPEGIAWSGDGSHAVLYSLTGNWLQTLSGLPGAPAVGARIDGSTLGGALASVAADAQGKHIAAGISGDSGAVYQSSDGQTFTKLKPDTQPMALSFSSDDLTLYVLDGSVPEVIAVNLSSSGYQTIPLKGLMHPIAIQAVETSQNTQLLYVAAASDRLLRILNIATQQIVTDVALSFQPTGLDQFGGNSFVVAARSQASNPLWLFTSSPEPAAYFVPAIHLRYPDRRVVEVLGGAR